MKIRHSFTLVFTVSLISISVPLVNLSWGEGVPRVADSGVPIILDGGIFPGTERTISPSSPPGAEPGGFAV